MATIFHIAPKENWTKSRSRGQYSEESQQREGFIHCSTAEQVVDTANKHFKGQSDLVILSIDTSDVLSSPTRAVGAAARSTRTYSALSTNVAVKEVIDFPASGDGTFSLPTALQK